MKPTIVVGAILMLLTIGAVEEAVADCYLNGKPYPTGTKFGPYTCMPDGGWRR
jgi:hypothetical protein